MTHKKQKTKPFAQKDPTKTKGVLEGQKGPKFELPLDRLNEKERAVLKVFNAEGPVRGWYSIATLAKWGFPVLFTKSPSRANSWVRNSLRRLVRGNWIEQPDGKEARGYFRLSVKAHHTLAKGVEQAEAKAISA